MKKIIDVDKKVWSKYRSYCLKEGIRLNKNLNEIINEYLEKKGVDER